MPSRLFEFGDFLRAKRSGNFLCSVLARYPISSLFATKNYNRTKDLMQPKLVEKGLVRKEESDDCAVLKEDVMEEGRGHSPSSTSCPKAAKEKRVTIRFHIKNFSVVIKQKKRGWRRKKKEEPAVTKKVILENVAGVVEPKQLLAIMGPSGAGKTTVLNCLSGRTRAFDGYVTFNGVAVEPDVAAAASAYVQQEDLFIPTLTPREHLIFHATMRMGAGASAAERTATVDRIIADLGLGKCQDTLIGGQGSIIRGISGGEKKRLSFATEILADPAVLFVDEPTSGLDSYMAASVVKILAAMAAAGRTIVATVHQPSSDVFALFTHLHLLADGRTSYFGPLGAAVGHFADLGHPCPIHYNPADFFIALLSKDPQASAESQARVLAVASAFPDSPAGRAVAAALAAAAAAGGGDGSSADEAGGGGARSGGVDADGGWLHCTAHHHYQYRASWLVQLLELYSRTLITYKREPVLTRVRFIQAVAVAVVVGLIYLQLGDSQQDVQSLIGALFFISINQSILSTFGVLQVFPNETPVLLREHAAGAYRVDAYFLGRTLAEMPFQVLFPAIFAAIVYGMIGLPADPYTFFMFVVTVILTANAAMSMGYFVSALAKNISVALALGPMLLMPLIIFGGLLVNFNNIPPYFKWLSYFSFVLYGYSATTTLVFDQKDRLECPPAPAPCSFPDGAAVIAYLGLDNWPLWVNWVALLCLIVGFRLLAYLGLVWRTRKGGGY